MSISICKDKTIPFLFRFGGVPLSRKFHHKSLGAIKTSERGNLHLLKLLFIAVIYRIIKQKSKYIVEHLINMFKNLSYLLLS